MMIADREKQLLFVHMVMFIIMKMINYYNNINDNILFKFIFYFFNK